MEIKFDQDQAYDFLLSFDLFSNKKEGENYLKDSYVRFLETIKIIPQLTPSAKILELGANPYFLTLLLRKFYGLKPNLANYFGESRFKKDKQILKSKSFKEKYTFNYKLFNIEKDIFPYRSETFDLVLCCEILEHLLLDPVFALNEIRRVLKPSGYLLITTPNVNRRENWFKLLGGRNIYDPYSGYGAYGRHNREYTIDELRDIVYINGFKIISAGSFFKTDHKFFLNNVFEKILAKVFHLETWGDHIFTLAQKNKSVNIPRRPEYLYRSLEKNKK